MAAKALNKSLNGRAITLVGVAGDIVDQCRQSLTDQGANVTVVEPPMADLFVEEKVDAALDGVSMEADGIVFIPGAFTDAVDSYVEECIGACLFALKLAMRSRANRPVDFLCLAGPTGAGEEAEIAQSIRDGALRQMVKVASAEGGPMDPPMTANVVFVAEEAALADMLNHLLGAPQSYVTGISLTLSA